MRNNKTKTVAVTFELGLMGLAWQFEVRGMSRGHAQPRWSADVEKDPRDLCRAAAVMLRPAQIRFKVI